MEENALDKDWLFATDEYICDLRTFVVLVKDKKIFCTKRETEMNMHLFFKTERLIVRQYVLSVVD